jgi:hypothetical protein
MFSTRYNYDHFGKTVSKDTAVCPHCGAHLVGIKCTNCGFVGSKSDFKNDRCPRCNSYVQTSKTITCPRCGKKWNQLFCKNCGKTNSLMIIVFLGIGWSGPPAFIFSVINLPGSEINEQIIILLVVSGIFTSLFVLGIGVIIKRIMLKISKGR